VSVESSEKRSEACMGHSLSFVDGADVRRGERERKPGDPHRFGRCGAWGCCAETVWVSGISFRTAGS